MVKMFKCIKLRLKEDRYILHNHPNHTLFSEKYDLQVLLKGTKKIKYYQTVFCLITRYKLHTYFITLNP